MYRRLETTPGLAEGIAAENHKFFDLLSGNNHLYSYQGTIQGCSARLARPVGLAGGGGSGISSLVWNLYLAVWQRGKGWVRGGGPGRGGQRRPGLGTAGWGQGQGLGLGLGLGERGCGWGRG